MGAGRGWVGGACVSVVRVHPYRPSPPAHPPTRSRPWCATRRAGAGREVAGYGCAPGSGAFSLASTYLPKASPAPARAARAGSHPRMAPRAKSARPGSGWGSGSEPPLSPLPSPSYRRLRKCRATPGRPSTRPCAGRPRRCLQPSPPAAPAAAAPAPTLTPTPAAPHGAVGSGAGSGGGPGAASLRTPSPALTCRCRCPPLSASLYQVYVL